LGSVQLAKQAITVARPSAATSRLRLILVGTPDERAALRSRLAESLQSPDAVVAGEFPTIAAARASAIAADAILTPRGRPDSTSDFAEPLTPREIEVLELLAEGLANKAIAARLRISDQTVKFHVSSICGKLAAANRTDAVRRAIRQGLITV
jgi:DNA-binding NarL/FixJ family response regulator